MDKIAIENRVGHRHGEQGLEVLQELQVVVVARTLGGDLANISFHPIIWENFTELGPGWQIKAG